jgi:hypothetical protein
LRLTGLGVKRGFSGFTLHPKRSIWKSWLKEGKSAGLERKTFIYVNIRLEGNTLETISAMVSDAE